jgi:hypothetical protein
MRNTTTTRITASICMLLFVLGVAMPQLLPARSTHTDVVKVAQAGAQDQDSPHGYPGKRLPFDEKDSAPERELTDSDERAFEKEADWLRVTIARCGQGWLQRVMLAQLRDHGDDRLGAMLGLPSYIALHALLI